MAAFGGPMTDCRAKFLGLPIAEIKDAPDDHRIQRLAPSSMLGLARRSGGRGDDETDFAGSRYSAVHDHGQHYG